MKKALISPIEPRTDSNGNSGYRVAFVCETEFEVAPPLFWVECSDDCVQDEWVYVNNSFVRLTPNSYSQDEQVSSTVIVL